MLKFYKMSFHMGKMPKNQVKLAIYWQLLKSIVLRGVSYTIQIYHINGFSKAEKVLFLIVYQEYCQFGH